MKVLIITGPTGVGKSGFADRFAADVPCEIINIDVGQLYQPLTIGTAKPDWRSAAIPHHLFDLLDTPRNISVTEYRGILKRLIDDIVRRGNLPILVGGSGFYINSLFFPPRTLITRNLDQPILTTSEDNTHSLWDQLHAIDPERAAQIHKNDRYRIERALDIWNMEKEKPSEFTPTFEPIAPAVIAFINRERSELYNRINKRTVEMITEGWPEEVLDLMDTEWEEFLKQKKLIGYDDILNYFAQPKDEQNMDRLIEVIQKKTRHYAKRQCTYNTMLIKKLAAQDSSDILIQDINLSLISADLGKEKLMEALQPK
ncbi:tRNA (adenosine(37)-N6)-dimethylallyltransferase MiaA [candidate division TM6 bacterium RIFCSPHIGHO2_12_FULL_36_22]|nr:MAG: tRNA (adenosine(37)-N6)-dimethylallyltransferase MiaA [candidate division TM6 bacterium RIFCSPHIGHO2_12_FULL_36_22]